MESPAPEARIEAELIVLSGRLKGSRRALTVPLTLLGQDASCDIRLNLDGIAPFHAALVVGPVGPVLRNLNGECSVLINGHAVENRLLHDGDVLTIGPFQFQVSLPPGTGLLPPPPPSEEALRIQAAAVTSEQVRLSELEGKLDQRRLELDTREQQLVGHLDEKRQRLETFQQQVKDERARLRADKESFAARVTELEAQERRTTELQRELQDRHDRHWKAEEESALRRSAKLEESRSALERDRAQLTRERQSVEALRLRLNTEAELAKHQLREERETLHLAQQQWEVVLNQEEQERQRKELHLKQREEAVGLALAALHEEERALAVNLDHLRKETRGLENRIASHRTQLTALEQELARRETLVRGRPIHQPVLIEFASTPPEPGPAAPAELRELAADLADQRLHLAEQWHSLLTRQQEWEDAKTAVLSELEAAATALANREQVLLRHEAAFADRNNHLEARLARVEAAESRLQVTAIEQTAEHARRLADVALREQAATEALARAETSSDRNARRVRRALNRLIRIRKQLETLHTQYADLWRSTRAALRAALQTQQELGRQRLAVERLRDEVLDHAANTPAAERRLEKLENEYVALWSREETDLKQEWKALEHERTVLDNLGRQNFGTLLGRVKQARTHQQQRSTREQRHALRERKRAEQEALHHRLESERNLAEQRAEALRAELERIALNLMSDTPASVAQPAESQAA